MEDEPPPPLLICLEDDNAEEDEGEDGDQDKEIQIIGEEKTSRGKRKRPAHRGRRGKEPALASTRATSVNGDRRQGLDVSIGHEIRKLRSMVEKEEENLGRRRSLRGRNDEGGKGLFYARVSFCVLSCFGLFVACVTGAYTDRETDGRAG